MTDLQISAQVFEELDKFPALKSDQYVRCEEAATVRVNKRLGEEPTLSNYLYVKAPEKPDDINWRRSIKSVIDPTDLLIPLILSILLVVSWTHMTAFAGIVAASSYQEMPTLDFQGLWLGRGSYTIIHQIGFFGFSELGVLFFYARNSLEYRRNTDRRRWLSINMFVSITCALVTVVANVTSLTHGAFSPDGSIDISIFVVGVCIGGLIPIITMFLGERVSEVILTVILKGEEEQKVYEEAAKVYRQSEITAHIEWQNAVRNWHQVLMAPEKYDEEDDQNSYNHYLASAVVDYYKKHIKINMGGEQKVLYTNWTPDLELLLGGRELSRVVSQGNLGAAMRFFTGEDNHQP